MPGYPSKLCCYIDETGQDTLGEFFIVVTVVVGSSDRDSLVSKLEAIEHTSGKGKAKWMKVRGRQRAAYITAVLSSPAFKNMIHFSRYHDTKSYMALTVLSTAKAILTAAPGQSAAVYVDGLPKSRLRWFGAELRRLSIRTSKVVGVRREETDALIRLADACCGFVRVAISGQQPAMTKLFDQGKATGHLVEV